ncbi:hypothetical protein ACIBI4_20535 [Streptomyces sp. NPDC050418]|uniref:hypothetical protein n=1 Tax=Streptomyces sp. NPDC050418 TaxID=3365612 RepID=UPI00379FA286
MENWREDALSGHTHDPNEVTVQIDGLGRLRADEALAAEGSRDADKPVFVDESGSRGRKVRRIGWIMGVVCAVYAVVLVATLASGNSDAPWMPGIGDDKKSSGKVKPSPSPTGPTSTADPGATPGQGESVGTGNPSPTGLPTGGPTPDPTDTGKPTVKPTDGGDPDPDPTTPDPDPDPTTPDPDPDPSDPVDPPDPTDPVDPTAGNTGGGGNGGNGQPVVSGADAPTPETGPAQEGGSHVSLAGAAL